jgi:hypothetical protein
MCAVAAHIYNLHISAPPGGGPPGLCSPFSPYLKIPTGWTGRTGFHSTNPFMLELQAVKAQHVRSASPESRAHKIYRQLFPGNRPFASASTAQGITRTGRSLNRKMRCRRANSWLGKADNGHRRERWLVKHWEIQKDIVYYVGDFRMQFSKLWFATPLVRHRYLGGGLPCLPDYYTGV